MITFWDHFRRLVVRKPVPATKAAFSHLTRRRLRARHQLRDATKGTDLAYPIWLKSQARVEPKVEAGNQPSFTVVIHSGEAKPDLRKSLHSVERQKLRGITVSIAPEADLSVTIAEARGDYIFFLRCGDELADNALAQLRLKLAAAPAAVSYGDEDHAVDERGGRQPWFKPDWNSEMFLSLDYLSRAVAVRSDVARQVMQDRSARVASTLDDLLLAITLRADASVAHLPAILVHAGLAKGDPRDRLAAVDRAYGDRAEVTSSPFDTIKVSWPLPEPLPLVSVIIPTRDKVDLLKACLDGLLYRTDYQPLEIIVVDNGSREDDALAYLKALADSDHARVISCDDAYNFSALNNLAARQAKGEFLCLLNNDTEVITPDWLTEMMRFAVREDVGAVGAKLLYSDGSLQHAGVVVGMGEAAGHAHRHLASGEPGYFRQPHVSQFVTAVTAACLLVKRSKYEAVGGLDEGELAIAYNDVDLCLKLRQAGWHNVYTPHAALYHHESKSRGDDLSADHLARYMRELKVLQDRWGTKTFLDPLHSPHLDRYSETFIPNLA